MKTISFMRNLIRKSLLMVGMGLVLSGTAVFAADPGMKTLHGHVPLGMSRLQAKGRLSATTNLTLAIGLPLRNTDALTNLLRQIYDPSSTNYHRYLTPDEFMAQFGPTEQDYQKVVDFANTNGLAVTKRHGNRVLLDVSGKVSDVEKAFHVTMHTYRHPTENRDFFAPDTEPSVPSALPVQDISGLDNYNRPHPKFTARPLNAAPKALSGSGPAGLYMGNDFRNAYVPGTPLIGSGQTIALVQFDGYLASDISEYENLTGRTNIPLQNVLIDGFSGVPTSNNGGGEVEVSLDIEMAISMAPALSKIILYEGNPNNFIPNDVLNRIATDNSARQVSCSWGWSGGPSGTTDQIFQQMALQGQTFFDAVGDSDAFTSGAGSVNGVDNPNTFNAPSDSPYITQVGGTTLTMNGAGASYASETVWYFGIEYGEDGVGSSGGISSFYSIPSWQTNINMTASQGSTTFRNTPDVALAADDVLVIADGGVEYYEGGTSCASPLWAGFTALVNQQATNNGHASVGFLNPALYSIAKGTTYTNCFHDITTGNNTWSQNPNLFFAVPGYDLCTGLGTPNGTNLINALVNIAGNFPVQITAPAPPYGSTLSALNGGNPNGAWSLFVLDDQSPDSGIISNGWFITLTIGSPVGFAADNALSMTASATNAPVNGNVTFAIGVTNYVLSASSNVLVLDTLPSGVTLVSSNSTMGSVSRNGSDVIWNIGTLATNAGAQLTLTMRSASVGTIVNSAIVQATTPDPDSDNNSASVAVNIGNLSPPQLSGSFAAGNHQFQFSINDPSQEAYVIQASTNLVTGPWVPIYTNPAPVTVLTTFTDSSATNYPYRFYRVLLQ